MATYPSYPVTTESNYEREDGLDTARASNGTLKIRAMWPSEKATFDVRHVLTAAERDTLETFYQTNKLLDVDFRWPGDGVTYTTRFVAAPKFTRVGQRYEARVRLAQV